jgi:hypothetical protein
MELDSSPAQSIAAAEEEDETSDNGDSGDRGR